MSITVSRTVVVRAHHQLDSVGCQHLDRILSDLIGSQGVADLIVDLSDAGPIDPSLKDVLDRAQDAIGRLGGTIEVRTPPGPAPALLELIDEIPAFAPVEPASNEPNPST